MSRLPEVVVTGGSSYLGEFVVRCLVAKGVRPHVAVRSTASAARVSAAGGTPFDWDLRRPVSAVRGDVLLHLAGIAFADQLGGWVQSTGAQRVVCVSSASVVVPGHPKAQLVRSKEASVHSAAPSTVMVRPTMIFGGTRDRNVQLLRNLLLKLPAAPRLTGGEHIQPVFVDDLAAVLAALTVTETDLVGTLTYGGKAPLRIGQVVRDLAVRLGRKVVPVPLPVRPVAATLRRTGLDGKGRYLHAVSMLQQPRVVPDPDGLGLVHRATPWHEALDVAVQRYATRDDRHLQ